MKNKGVNLKLVSNIYRFQTKTKVTKTMQMCKYLQRNGLCNFGII